jgi:hypothetical protein
MLGERQAIRRGHRQELERLQLTDRADRPCHEWTGRLVQGFIGLCPNATRGGLTRC